MPKNVGSRKRAANAADTSAPKKPKASARRYRRRPYGALGGWGSARMDQAVVYNRKQPNSLMLKKTLFNASVFNGAGAYVGTTGYFTAANLPDWNYAKQLFSHYRFKRIKLVITLMDYVGGDGSAFSNTRMPEIFLKQNTDPAMAIPTGTASLQEYANVMSFQMTPERTRCEFIIEPKVLRPVAIVTDSANQGYEVSTPPWTMVADGDIQNWGYVFFADYLHTSFRILIDHEYDVEFKNEA